MIIKPLLHIPPTVQKHLQADEKETSAELITTYPLSIPDVYECPRLLKRKNPPFLVLLACNSFTMLIQQHHSLSSIGWERGLEEGNIGSLWCCSS